MGKEIHPLMQNVDLLRQSDCVYLSGRYVVGVHIVRNCKHKDSASPAAAAAPPPTNITIRGLFSIFRLNKQIPSVLLRNILVPPPMDQTSQRPKYLIHLPTHPSPYFTGP